MNNFIPRVWSVIPEGFAEHLAEVERHLGRMTTESEFLALLREARAKDDES